MESTILYNYSGVDTFYTDKISDILMFKVWDDKPKVNNEPKDIYPEFLDLRTKWINDTRFLSNPELIFGNKHYKKIISLGVEVIPYLIADLETHNTDWLFALNQILKIDPIEQNHIGSFELMKNDWIGWVNENLGVTYA